jgi:hypothetical protein
MEYAYFGAFWTSAKEHNLQLWCTTSDLNGQVSEIRMSRWNVTAADTERVLRELKTVHTAFEEKRCSFMSEALWR